MERRAVIAGERRRLTARQVVDHLESYGAAHEAAYAGIYKDNDELVVGFTSEINEHSGALRSLVPAADIRIVKVRWPLAALLELSEELKGASDALREDGVAIAGVGIDVAYNVVEVVLAPTSASNAERVLQAAYRGRPVRVERCRSPFGALRLVPRPGPGNWRPELSA